MSRTIDEKIVSMQFDNKRFESNVKTSLSTIDKLNDKLQFKDAGKGFQSIENESGKVKMSALDNAVNRLHKKFSAMEVVAVTALVNITNSAINAGKRIASALTIDPIKSGFQEYETQINAVQTILANTESKGSTLQNVNSALAELNAYADKTVYNFTEMTRNIGTFTAAGVGLKESTAAIKGIANLAAVSGSNSQQASTAMYQLSQALAQGKVMLQDWNSIVNAGMGGQVFQDAIKETARVHGVAIDEMIKTDGSFRSTLEKGWLTSDILTETLNKFTGDLNESQLKSMGYNEKQIAQIIKMGQTANDAATKVKTVSQLYDTLKEAAQSGWTQSWELIIGDFGEAKELLTNISNTIGNIIGDSADARNKLIRGGLSTGWKELLASGINDETKFKESIMETAKQHGVAADKMIKDAGSFEKSLKKGWLTSDILTESIGKFTDKVSKMSGEQLTAAGYTKEQVASLKELNENVKNGTISMDEFSKKIMRESGRANLIDALKNSFEAVMVIIKPVKEAFRDIFPKMTGEQLYNITVGIKNLSEKFKISDEAAANLKDTFKGLFSILDLSKTIIGGLIKGILPLFGILRTGGGGILDFTAKIGRFIVSLNNAIKASNIFTITSEGITKGLTFLGEKIKYVIDLLKNKIQIPELQFDSFKDFGDIVDFVKNKLESFIATIKRVFNAVYNFFKPVVDFFKKVVFGVFGGIGRIIKSIMDGISGLSFDNLLSSVNTGALIAMALGIKKFFSTLSKSAQDITETIQGGSIFTKIKETFAGVTEVLGSLKDCLANYQQQLKAKTLLSIALAVGILALSITMLSSLDKDKMMNAITGLTMLFAQLLGSMAIFNKIDFNVKSAGKTTTIMIGMSVAVLILASALKKLSGIDRNGLVQGGVAVMSLMSTMTLCMKMIGESRSAIKGAAGILAFAVAIKILASVVKDLSALSWTELAKGLGGVMVLMAVMSETMSKTKFKLKMQTLTLSMIGLAVAIKILASAVKDLSGLSWTELATGLSGVMVLMVMMSEFMSKTKFKLRAGATAVAMVIIAASLKILASVVKDLSTLSWTELAKGLAGVIVMIAMLSEVMSKTKSGFKPIATATAFVVIAASLKILASAVKDFGSMDNDQLVRGLSGMMIGLLGIASAIKVMPKSAIIMAPILLILSTALIGLAFAMSKMGSMSWEEIGKGLTVLGGSILILSESLRLMTKSIPGSLALILAVGALALFIPILGILGSMSWETIAKGLALIAGAFTVLGLAGLLLKPLIPSIALLSASLVMVGAGLLIAGVGVGALGVGVHALVLALGALISVVANGCESLVDAAVAILIGIAKALPVLIEEIGKALVAIGEMLIKAVPPLMEGIKTLFIGMLQIIVPIVKEFLVMLGELLVSIFDSLVEYTPKVVKGLLDFLIVLFESLAEKIGPVVDAIVDLVIAIVEAVVKNSGKILSSIFKALKGILNYIVDAIKKLSITDLVKMATGIGILAAMYAALALLKNVVKKGLIVLTMMAGGMALIGGLMALLALLPVDNLTNVGTVLCEVLIGLSVAMIIMSKIPVSAAAEGIAGLAVVIGGLALILAALGGIKQIPGVEWLISEGSEFMTQIGYAIGNFVGSIIGGFGAGLTSGLPEIADNLTNFMNRIQGFIQGAQNIDAASLEGVKVLAETILILTAADLLNGIAKFITGGTNFNDFADKAKSLGEGVVAFNNATKGKIDAESVKIATNAGLMISELSNSIPKSGGLWQALAGEQNIGDFADKMGPLAKGIVAFSDEIKKGDLDPAAIEMATNAGKLITELSSNIPRTGGLWAKLSGDNDPEKFADKMGPLAQGIVDFSSKIKDGGLDSSSIEAGCAAGKLLTELASSVPESGGLFSWLTGDNGIDTFGENIVKFGDSLVTYSNNTADIDTSKMDEVTNAAIQISALCDNLSNTDYDGISSFCQYGRPLSEGLATFSSNIADVDPTNVMLAVNAFAAINTALQGFNTVDLNGVNTFMLSISEVGTISVSKICSEFTNGSPQIANAVSSMFVAAMISINTNKENIINAFDGTMTYSLNKITSRVTDFMNAGTTIISNVAQGVNNGINKVSDAFTRCISGVISTVNNKYTSFIQMGAYMVEGFAKGIDANTYKARAAAQYMAHEAEIIAAKELDEHSPSKKFVKIGKFVSLGFANGINKYAEVSTKAAKDMGSNALNSMNTTIAQLTDSINNNIDSNPTIKPILDLSNIKKQGAKLNSLISTNKAFDVSADMNRIQTSNTSQNGISGTIDSSTRVTFTQNNYSPKALSRIDIYRQTKNQLSQIKKVVR